MPSLGSLLGGMSKIFLGSAVYELQWRHVEGGIAIKHGAWFTYQAQATYYI